MQNHLAKGAFCQQKDDCLWNLIDSEPIPSDASRNIDVVTQT